MILQLAFLTDLSQKLRLVSCEAKCFDVFKYIETAVPFVHLLRQTSCLIKVDLRLTTLQLGYNLPQQGFYFVAALEHTI